VELLRSMHNRGCLLLPVHIWVGYDVASQFLVISQKPLRAGVSSFEKNIVVGAPQIPDTHPFGSIAYGAIELEVIVEPAFPDLVVRVRDDPFHKTHRRRM
jgi:hypothetical protein